MKNRELLSSLIWIGLGVAFLIGSWQQGLFRKGVPGPGFLPFFYALFLIVLSSMVFLPALGRKKEERAGPVEKFFPEDDSLKKILLGLAALFAYGIVLEYTGYLVTTFLFMAFSSRLMEPKKWGTVLTVAACTAVLSYLLFVVFLEVQLPGGILGI
jgi:hypothetical protein